MTFDISKDFAFSADHRLTGLADGHKCGRFHGHNYVVRVRLAAARLTVPPGFVVDYGDLAPFGAYLDAVFDHRWLGAGTIGLVDEQAGAVSQVTAPAFAVELAAAGAGISANPTAENLAAWFRWWLTADGNVPALTPGLEAQINPVSVEVGVSETPKTWAWAR